MKWRGDKTDGFDGRGCFVIAIAFCGGVLTAAGLAVLAFERIIYG